MRRILLLLFSTTGTLLPMPVLAHVKWFVPHAPDSLPVVPPFSFGEPAVLVWLLLGCTMVCASVLLDRRLPAPPALPPWLRQGVQAALAVLTGLALLMSSESGVLLAPHFRINGGMAQALLWLQAVTGVLLLLPWTVFAGAALLLLFYLLLGLSTGPVILEYLNIPGVALFLLFLHWPQPLRRARLQPWALPLLRILTGIALVTLGLSEKLLRPDYAQAFLDSYMWNFMRTLGVESYSDRLFVLSAGTMEVVFGLILILGTTTRLNILVVSLFMLTSNLTFFMQGRHTEALVEIIGHLPIIAIALLCVFCGGGQRLRLGLLGKRVSKADGIRGFRTVRL